MRGYPATRYHACHFCGVVQVPQHLQFCSACTHLRFTAMQGTLRGLVERNGPRSLLLLQPSREETWDDLLAMEDAANGRGAA